MILFLQHSPWAISPIYDVHDMRNLLRGPFFLPVCGGYEKEGLGTTQGSHVLYCMCISWETAGWTSSVSALFPCRRELFTGPVHTEESRNCPSSYRTRCLSRCFITCKDYHTKKCKVIRCCCCGAGDMHAPPFHHAGWLLNGRPDVAAWKHVRVSPSPAVD